MMVKDVTISVITGFDFCVLIESWRPRQNVAFVVKKNGLLGLDHEQI